MSRRKRTLERSHLLSRLGGVESEELGELGSVLGVFVNTKLEVLSESLVELGEVVLVLGDLGEHVHALLDDVLQTRRRQGRVSSSRQRVGRTATNLSDNLQDLVLLEGLSGDVEGEILRVHDSSDEVEVLRDEVLAVVHDEDSSDVELDVVPLLLGLEEIEGSPMERSESEKKSDASRTAIENADK